MKKIILVIVVALGSFSIYASRLADVKSANTIINFQTEYTEIAVKNVPAAIKTALETAYPKAALTKAYVNDKKEYKLEIAVDGQKAVVYSDVNGSWLKI